MGVSGKERLTIYLDFFVKNFQTTGPLGRKLIKSFKIDFFFEVKR